MAAMVATGHQPRSPSRPKSGGCLKPSKRDPKVRHKTRLIAKHYSDEEWRANRSIITQIYADDKEPIKVLIERLHQLGFQVK